jgi:aquaporin Z
VIGTTAVVYVMLNVATVRHLARNSFFGIAIGITIASVGSAIGPVSGGCLNPAIDDH